MRSILDDLSPSVKDEVMASARDFMADPLMKAIARQLHENYVAVLAGEQVYSLTAVDAHASIRVLEQVIAEISNLRGHSKVLNRGRD